MLEIPGYKIIKKLGEGGMASVYLAIQESIDREVAIKVMSHSLVADPSFSERFLKEARMAHLTHPNIVTVYDAGKIEDQSYIVMEYATGGNLSQKIREGITVREIISVIKQISAALNYAHSNNVVHRDIKSENILLKGNGDALLVDFGIAKALTSNTQLTQINTTIGSPNYMSPEQARGLTLDGRSDLYSLGVVFFECLSGKKPFEAEDTFAIGIKHISDPVPELPLQLSMFQSIINCLLAKTPEGRYQNSKELIRVLDDVFETLKKDNSPILTMMNNQFVSEIKEEESGGNLQEVSMRNIDVTKLRADDKTEIIISPSEYNRHSSIKDNVESSKNNNKLLAVVMFIVITSGGALWYNYKFQPTSMFASITEKLSISAEQKNPEQIERLLEQAEKYIDQRQYTTPKEANAYDIFQQVLRLDPENNSAQNGLKNIVKKYQTMAVFRLADFQYESALKMVHKGLVVDSEHPALQELKKSIELQMQTLQMEATEKPKLEAIEKPEINMAEKPKMKTIKKPQINTIEKTERNTVVRSEIKTTEKPEINIADKSKVETLKRPQKNTIKESEINTVVQSELKNPDEPEIKTIEKLENVAIKKQIGINFYKSAIVQDHSLFETAGEHVSNSKKNLKSLARQDLLNNVYMKILKHCNATGETMASADCKTIYQRYYSNWPIPGLKATYSESINAGAYQAKYVLDKADMNTQLTILSDLAIDILKKSEGFSEDDELMIANYELAKPLLSLNGTELLADTSKFVINDTDTSRIPKVNSLRVLIPMIKDKMGVSFSTVSFLQKGSLEVTPFDIEVLKQLRKNLLDPSLNNIGPSLHATYTHLPSDDINVEFWSFNEEGYVQGRKRILLDKKIGDKRRNEAKVPVLMLTPQKNV